MACATRLTKLCACAAGLFGLAACAPAGDFVVIKPVLETEPVGQRGDAADDPAILVSGENAVWIVGTDKQSGLRVYDLQGAELHNLETGRLNNVDAVPVDDESFLVAASNRTTPAIDLYEARPDRNEISLVKRIPVDLLEPYGLCMAQLGDRVEVFVGDTTGNVQRWSIAPDLDGTLEGEFRFDSQTEGCVVDSETETLYVGEEVRGIWSVSLDDASKRLIASVDGEQLVADVEGLDIYSDGTRKMLVASSQGDSTYVVYELPAGEQRLKFAIGRNLALGIDGTSDTDGLAVTSAPLPGFPQGVLVVQDGYNALFYRNQNFKLVDWRAIGTLID